jgi:hypothetical protein
VFHRIMAVINNYRFRLTITTISSFSNSLIASPSNLAQKIAAHNRSLRKKEFDAQTWDCGICLDAKKGRFCVRFDGEQEGQDEGEGCGCVL